jgi:hypothetical protein
LENFPRNSILTKKFLASFLMYSRKEKRFDFIFKLLNFLGISDFDFLDFPFLFKVLKN